MNEQIKNLQAACETKGVRLCRDHTIDHPMGGKLHLMRLVSLKPGQRPAHAQAIIHEFSKDEGGYQLFIDSVSIRIEDDVRQITDLIA